MLIFHTALHAEARALIDYYRLKRLHDLRAFSCYASDHIFLVESGIGKIDTAAAIGWAGGRLSEAQPVWLNVGMAGHATAEIGTLLLAHRIEDQRSGKRYYPPQLLHPVPSSENLLTVDRPVDRHPRSAMVDMEASAFIRGALHFSSMELVQSLKIISDNPKHPPRKLKTADVEALISPHTEQIDDIAQQLLSMRRQLQDATVDIQQQLTERWRMSHYQRNQLGRLVQRYDALFPDHKLIEKIPDSISNGKQLIRWLEDTLAPASLHY
jgi:hypothetical protein